MNQKTRLSVPLNNEVYEQLRQMSVEYGISMSALGSQMITQHIKTYQTVFETLGNPEKMSDLVKAIAKSDNK